MIAILGAMAALAGNGGLTNTNVSGYTRDQGWGMGKHVGAIPSVVGGHSVKLSHVGMVFPSQPESKKRFAGWYRHIFRDQFFLFGIASFIGLALPSMLSVQFLPRGTDVDTWLAAGMTADGVYDAVGSPCAADGRLVHDPVLRLPRAGPEHHDDGRRLLPPLDRRALDRPARAAVVEAAQRRQALLRHALHLLRVGLCILAFVPQGMIMKWATNIYNYALGFSCLHVLYVNLTLLPRELRPNWFIRIGAGLRRSCSSSASPSSRRSTLDQVRSDSRCSRRNASTVSRAMAYFAIASRFSSMPRPGPVGTRSMPSASSLNGVGQNLFDVRHAGLELDPAGHRHGGRERQVGRDADRRVPAVRHQQHAVIVRDPGELADLRSGRRTSSGRAE